MPASDPKKQQKYSWQEALSDLITDPKELMNELQLSAHLSAEVMAAHQLFPLKVPRRYVARIKKRNLNDALLRQILPLGNELNEMPGYEGDPLHERERSAVPGLLHKYAGRVLLTLTSACAIHCRYCFRRHFPYKENNPVKDNFKAVVDYLRLDESIHEVILSGGDPLTVNDRILTLFSHQLAEMSHIKILRIHTRIPSVLPERITPEFIHWVKTLRMMLVMVLHVNHPNELDLDVKEALLALKRAGANLFNQSVLLKDVNDDAKTLITLSESLFAAGVLPYYLHVMDKVAGAHHFDVDLAKAYHLHAEMRKHLPGYLVPRLAREVPGLASKKILA